MKTPRLQLFQYKLPFQKALTMKGITYTYREGLILRFAMNGREGFGEIAPLPGFSRESITDVVRDFAETAGVILGWDWSDVVDDPDNFWEVLCQASLLPSVKTGVAMAVLQLYRPKWWVLAAPTRIPVNGLIPSDIAKDAVRDAQDLVDKGFKVIKIKVHGDPQREAQKVNAIRASIGSQITFRLDANRCWTLKQARDFVQALSDLKQIEYIEDPCQTYGETEELFKTTGVLVALDELMTGMTDEVLNASEFILVFKPTLRGDFRQMWSGMRGPNPRKVVISSSFESGLGMHFLAHLAALNPKPWAAGLGTSQWLAHDVLRNPFTLSQGHLLVENYSPQMSDFHWNLLTLVASS